MIFSRKPGGPGRHVRTSGEPGRPRSSGSAPEIPARGPYDASAAPGDVERLDLGSLHIPAVEGVEVRVQADPDGTVQQVVLVWNDSALQLGAFAAPKSEGIWDEVRAEIAESMVADGVASQELNGGYGTELRARAETPQGPVDLRFVGFDGPRWMVRGVFQGAAASDPDREGLLRQCLTGLVVDRGADARPVREPLPLRLPKEMAEHARGQAEAEHAGHHHDHGPDGQAHS